MEELLMKRVSFETMKKEIKRALLSVGMTEEKADVCAQIHSESSAMGVYSHGLNRVSRFVDYVKKGWVDVNAEPSLVNKMGAIENYDGNRGPGILNAKFAMNRAMELAAEQGIGFVTLKNTTHWMRGGSYGWQAADKGFIGISWTNTESCMPAWGAKTTCLGNNPFVMAVPREGGNIVVDMAMSQYAYGKLQVTRLKNEKLPFPGGFDKDGNLTSDPGPIEESMRILPMGYWKGSGFAMVLDVISALVSGGLATVDIDKVNAGSCGGCSQVFIAIDPYKVGGKEYAEKLLNDTVEHVKNAQPAKENGEIFYPGELEIKTRKDHMENGIIVDEDVWNEVLNL
jgi:3-dehydro-L-gulonate 2-dehydrogenase